MGAIHLVRHGQASFGSGDYDRLSETGHLQAELTGRDMAARGLRPDVVIHGGMRRQRETAQGLVKGLREGLREGAG
ncbi:phosphoglycerate mutase family protein, partial [Dietzia sp. SYD-A1]|uniref:phosphoglycerate mutase family protein n=1 Tax=Dietzia sp. SYD-A1 TaxID=2780141 RepID=UPI0018911140